MDAMGSHLLQVILLFFVLPVILVVAVTSFAVRFAARHKQRRLQAAMDGVVPATSCVACGSPDVTHPAPGLLRCTTCGYEGGPEASERLAERRREELSCLTLSERRQRILWRLNEASDALHKALESSRRSAMSVDMAPDSGSELEDNLSRWVGTFSYAFRTHVAGAAWMLPVRPPFPGRGKLGTEELRLAVYFENVAAGLDGLREALDLGAGLDSGEPEVEPGNSRLHAELLAFAAALPHAKGTRQIEPALAELVTSIQQQMSRIQRVEESSRSGEPPTD